MNRGGASRLAQAMRNELWFSASDELLERPADRGGMTVGLNPPEGTEDAELYEVVWRALRSVKLAEEE